MRWLKKLEEFINLEFPNSDWADKLNTDNSEETFTKNLIEKEKNTIEKAFELLNFSALEGEHVNYQKEFHNLIQEIYSKVANLQNAVIANDVDFKLSAKLSDSEFLLSLKKSLQFFKRVADNIIKQIESPNKTIVIDISDSLEGIGKYLHKKGDVFEESLFDLFHTNLVLSRTGFFLENTNNQFSYLIETINELENLKSKLNIPSTHFIKIIDILIEICVFYQRKIIIRICQDNSRFHDKYVLNLNEFDFSLESHPLKNNYFKKWDEYSQNHFYSETSKERENFLRRNAEISKSTNTFWDVHSMIKYYKDINPDIHKLENKLEFFRSYNAKTTFDQYALNVSNNYLNNNILSFKIDKVNLDELDEVLSAYKNLQEKSSINNFFPYYKLCRYLKNYIEERISYEKIKSINNGNFESAEKALEKLIHCYSLYKQNIEWSQNHLYYSFQLPFNESLTEIEMEKELTIKAFIPSTFSLTINYKVYNDFLKELDYFIINVKNEIKTLKNISFLTSKLVQKEEEIKSELKDQGKKNIELLSIFTAILALIFGGITTASGSANFEEKFLTFISLFIVLFSFITLIKTFISKERNLFETLALFVTYIISLILIIFVLAATVKVNH